MKKLIYLMLLAALLCGCTAAAQTTAPTQTTAAETTVPQVTTLPEETEETTLPQETTQPIQATPGGPVTITPVEPIESRPEVGDVEIPPQPTPPVYTE